MLERGSLMAVTLPPSSPVAHLPLGLGGVRQLSIAALSAPCGPPHPAPVLACGRGVAGRRLAMRDGPQALDKGGTRGGAREAPRTPGWPAASVGARGQPRP